MFIFLCIFLYICQTISIYYLINMSQEGKGQQSTTGIAVPYQWRSIQLSTQNRNATSGENTATPGSTKQRIPRMAPNQVAQEGTAIRCQLLECWKLIVSFPDEGVTGTCVWIWNSAIGTTSWWNQLASDNFENSPLVWNTRVLGRRKTILLPVCSSSLSMSPNSEPTSPTWIKMV